MACLKSLTQMKQQLVNLSPMPMAAATATASSFQQHFTRRKWKHRERKWGWKSLDPQRAGLCFPIVLAQLSLCWSRALLQLGPKAAAKEKPRQPSVQEEEGCAWAAVLICAGEESWRAGGPTAHICSPSRAQQLRKWDSLAILSRNHREWAYRATVLESRTSTFSWLCTTAALTKDPEGQDLPSQARAGLHAVTNSSITSPSKNTIGCACFQTSQGVLGPKEDFKSYHSMLLMHLLSSTCRAGAKSDTSGKIVSLLKSPKQLSMASILQSTARAVTSLAWCQCRESGAVSFREQGVKLSSASPLCPEGMVCEFAKVPPAAQNEGLWIPSNLNYCSPSQRRLSVGVWSDGDLP